MHWRARSAKTGLCSFSVTRREVLREGLAKARAQWPRLRIDGSHGFFSIEPGSPEAMEAVHRVNEFAPDILFLEWACRGRNNLHMRFGPKLSGSGDWPGRGGICLFWQASNRHRRDGWGALALSGFTGSPPVPGGLAFRYLIEPALLAFSWLAGRHERLS